MAQIDVRKLEEVDLTQLTVADVLSLKNDVMRRALLEVFVSVAKPPEHTSHAAHSNHYKTMAIEFENPLVGPR